MKVFLFVILAIAAVSSSEIQFKAFKAQFGKQYLNSREEQLRQRIFLRNLEKIEEHNAKFEQGLVSYKLGVNQFADKTNTEFKKMLTGRKARSVSTEQPVNVYVPPENITIPESFDWRTKGAVLPVKDQGQCGSCWSFSVTGALEGQMFLKYGELISLSEQQLIDCSNDYDNWGCDGGDMVPTFQYIADVGIETEKDYKYTGRDGSCKEDDTKLIAKADKIYHIESRNVEHQIAALVNEGPLSVAIDASSWDFQLYDSGVFDLKGCLTKPEELDHAIVAVGYNKAEKYWLAKNQWGTSWGEEGYIKVSIDNDCGVSSDSSYATIVKIE